MTADDAVNIRKELSIDQRNSRARLTIDTGFVNVRAVETVLGPPGVRAIDQQIRALPDLPEWQRSVRIGHIYRTTVLAFCEHIGIPPLGALLAAGKGRMFCSVETLAPCPEVYDRARVVNRVVTPGVDSPTVELHYSTQHITSDTLRMELHEGDRVAVVAILHQMVDDRLIFHPLVMGGPWLVTESELFPEGLAECWSYDFFEQFVEDIDEFAQVRAVMLPDDFGVMEWISEAAFKRCLAEILGENPSKDWGGEMSDLFSAHVHLSGRPISAAFLLKGPANFRPMGLNHLGKNNDQIYRLSQEPAQLLVVQHAHDILSPVRATLRAFAVQPGNARRYCLIDGRDSLRLLQAYKKLNRALELSGSVAK